MSKVVKRMMIDQIRQRLGDCRDLIVIDTSKLDAQSDNQLRLELHRKGISLMSVKNTLARIALREGEITPVESVFEGPSTLVWGGEDIVSLSKEMTSWAKKIDDLEIKGATVDGQGVDEQGVEELSKSPSRLELIGQISGLLLSPGATLSGALLGPGGKLAGQIKSKADDENEENSGDAA